MRQENSYLMEKLKIKKYDHKKIDAKWQKFWLKNKAFEVKNVSKKENFYVLDMFAYPSGEGLHVGHPRGYVGSDVLAHYYHLKGLNVMHPMGFDAFGLPAENAAIKAGLHPMESIPKNIERFTKQLQVLGLAYDWGRAINTSVPEYYKWTQWLFSVLYKNGWAYQKESYVNWCPKDKTVLANEQVVNNCCDRCGATIVQKKKKQWFFKITDFAEELLSGLDKLDWPESTKELQRNWIGKSTGAELTFEVIDHKKTIKVFTTRADTLFGATYLVLAPEYEGLKEFISKDKAKEVGKYIKLAKQKTELERISDEKNKSGVFTGSYAINPANGEKIPIWVADYVLANYAFGAVMAVPAHDKRDYEFAKKHKLLIVEVVSSPGGKLPYTGHGKLVNSGKFGGKDSNRVANLITKEVKGKLSTKYKLRDWSISRQRYWGSPIPVFYDENDQPILVDEKDLPIILPKNVEFKPTGESPLVGSREFNKIPEKYKKLGAVKKECDTMDTFVCSSWYFIRYADPHNNKKFADTKKIDKWLPVNIYVGGAEHATGHLLYARFITKALHKLGLLNFDEPFLSLRHQGMILGDDGKKMSKSKGNVVNPDEIIEAWGADALRVYEMFVGPFDQWVAWDTAGIEGVRKFLNRVWSFVPVKSALATDEAIHKLIKKITLDIENTHFNTAISSFMEFTNLAVKKGISKKTLNILIILLSPFAPHLAEEMNYKLGNKKSVFESQWPKYDPKKLQSKKSTVAIQVNGKLRGTIEIDTDLAENRVKELAMKVEAVQRHLADEKNPKYHYVPNKIINFIAKK